MAQVLKLKRSATPAAVPTTGQLDLGEVAINTYDGKMYIKKDDGTAAIVEIGAGGGSGGGASFSIGTILAAPSAPTGDGTWLACDGSSVSQTTYSALFSAIGHKYFIPEIVEGTYTGVTNAPTNGVNTPAYLNGTFLTMSNNMSPLHYSTDGGNTWSVYSSFVSGATRTSSVVNGYFICSSNNTAYTISAQNDGTLMYTTSPTGWAAECYDIAYSSSLNVYVAVGNSTFGARYTSNPFGTVSTAPSGTTFGTTTGVTWSTGSGLAGNTRQIIWNGTNFVTLNSSGSIRWSSNGITFSTATLPLNTPALDGGLIWWDDSQGLNFALIPVSNAAGTIAHIFLKSTTGQTWESCALPGIYTPITLPNLHHSTNKTPKLSTGAYLVASSNAFAMIWSDDNFASHSIIPAFGAKSWSTLDRKFWVEVGDFLHFRTIGPDWSRFKFKDSTNFKLPFKPGYYIKSSS